MNNKLKYTPFLALFIFFSGGLFAIQKATLLFFVLLFMARKYYSKFIDLNIIFIFLLCTFYGLISRIGVEDKTIFPPSMFIIPVILYAMGKWMAYKTSDSVQLVKLFYLLGFSLASPTLLAVINDVSQFGFEGGSRSIALTDDGEEMSATVVGANLIILISFAGLFFDRNGKFGLFWKFIVLLFFSLSLLVSLRLGNRTWLVIAGVSVLCGIFYNMRNNGGVHLFLLLIPSFLIAYLIFFNISNVFELDFYFRDRIDSNESGAFTAGGRLERWTGSIALIPSNPIGWEINKIGYAHNLWLDIARNGGWLPLILSIVLTGYFVNNFKLAMIRSRGDTVFSTFAICLSIGFLLLFLVEPILDGFHYVFGIFCVFFGVLKVRSSI